MNSYARPSFICWSPGPIWNIIQWRFLIVYTILIGITRFNDLDTSKLQCILHILQWIIRRNKAVLYCNYCILIQQFIRVMKVFFIHFIESRSGGWNFCSAGLWNSWSILDYVNCFFSLGSISPCSQCAFALPYLE